MHSTYRLGDFQKSLYLHFIGAKHAGNTFRLLLKGYLPLPASRRVCFARTGGIFFLRNLLRFLVFLSRYWRTL
jgi:hypothetical protein